MAKTEIFERIASSTARIATVPISAVYELLISSDETVLSKARELQESVRSHSERTKSWVRGANEYRFDSALRTAEQDHANGMNIFNKLNLCILMANLSYGSDDPDTNRYSTSHSLGHKHTNSRGAMTSDGEYRALQD